MEKTVEDFWNMIINNKITRIVAIIEEAEIGADKKCFPYWPVEGKPLHFGDIEI